jgi:hypothetical protein
MDIVSSGKPYFTTKGTKLTKLKSVLKLKNFVFSVTAPAFLYLPASMQAFVLFVVQCFIKRTS